MGEQYVSTGELKEADHTGDPALKSRFKARPEFKALPWVNCPLSFSLSSSRGSVDLEEASTIDPSPLLPAEESFGKWGCGRPEETTSAKVLWGRRSSAELVLPAVNLLCGCVRPEEITLVKVLECCRSLADLVLQAANLLCGCVGVEETTSAKVPHGRRSSADLERPAVDLLCGCVRPEDHFGKGSVMPQVLG